jgi:mannan endo-1,6-alpha-mannosidase
MNLMENYKTERSKGLAVGLLPQPYYWWEAGAMWGSMVEYQHYTGDHTYDTLVAEAILSQASPTNDFMMENQHFDLGNDDQVFWALTAMSAAEFALPVPSGTPKTIWQTLATNVFDLQLSRWNTSTCNGGLKWQFFPQNRGFDYKSSIANGGFFQLAARLARYTGDYKYVNHASTVWEWMASVKFLDESTWQVFDGAGDAGTDNCTHISGAQWSYNTAILIHGAATLANITDPTTTPWHTRAMGLLGAATTRFFGPYPNATGIMYEYQCERSTSCNVDELSFKAYLARWINGANMMVPGLSFWTQAWLLKPSAKAAAQACSPAGSGQKGLQCGGKWWLSGGDGTVGVGQNMAALETVQGLLVGDVGGMKTLWWKE